MTLRIVFAGTPAFALPCLNALADVHTLAAIYTQPDRPAGRGRQMQPSAVKTWALTHQVPVEQPLDFKNDNTIQTLRMYQPDVLVVIAYGLILPTVVLTLPPLGCLNVHASLLPRYRGASPIQQAILQGDTTTGISIMQLDKTMDTGAVYTQVTCPILTTTTTENLHDTLSTLAITPLLQTLDALAHHQAQATPQDHALATYAPKITKEDARIDWQQPASTIDRQIRAFTPWPIAQTMAHGTVLRIHQAHVIPTEPFLAPGTVLSLSTEGLLVTAGTDALMIDALQWPGGKVLTVKDALPAIRHAIQDQTVFQ